MTTHLEESLQHDLQQLRAEIARMSRFTERMLRDTVVALDSNDRELASLIILRDERVDLMEKNLDQLCLQFIVRHQPAAGHLRFVYVALQINFELERIGDYAESIARQIMKLADLSCRAPKALFAEITSTSISMLRNAINAFVRQDDEMAEVTGQMEERVDVLRNQVNTELMHLLQTGKIPLAALTPLMTIARRFERVSDQAKSICQETIYLCTGEYAKHTSPHLYRVLFVDEDHGCLSRMAQAIGQELRRPEVQFESAGVRPKPLPPSAASMLLGKGLSRETLSEVRDLSGLDQYQLVIALSQKVRDQLPTPSRKSAQFTWSLADPCSSSPDAQALSAELDLSHRTLSQKIPELVERLVGEERSKT